jgi:hypothetical protein
MSKKYHTALMYHHHTFLEFIDIKGSGNLVYTKHTEFNLSIETEVTVLLA